MSFVLADGEDTDVRGVSRAAERRGSCAFSMLALFSLRHWSKLTCAGQTHMDINENWATNSHQARDNLGKTHGVLAKVIRYS